MARCVLQYLQEKDGSVCCQPPSLATALLRGDVMRKIRLAVLLAVLGLTTGCSPYAFRSLVGAAIITAAVVGTAHVLAHHDHHYHDHYCGHSRRWHDGRDVYYYQDRWEYYDPDTRRWYHYH